MIHDIWRAKTILPAPQHNVKSLSFHERDTDEWGKQKNGTEIIKWVTRNIGLEKQK